MLLNLELIDNHSIDADLVPSKNFVLDVGSRDYRFAAGMVGRFDSVVLALDPDPTVKLPNHPNISLLPFALVGSKEPKHQNLVMTGDPEARYLIEVNRANQWPQVPVSTITLKEVVHAFRVDHIDVIKLNCEGMEYGILEDIGEPIATQLSIAFHEHGQYPHGREVCDRIVSRLEKWYRVVQHEWQTRYSAGWSYWDTLLVRKDLA